MRPAGGSTVSSRRAEGGGSSPSPPGTRRSEAGSSPSSSAPPGSFAEMLDAGVPLEDARRVLPAGAMINLEFEATFGEGEQL